MPEGHTIHRAARDHHKKLAGQRLKVFSPQGRFEAGAKILTGKRCRSVEALGKHLLYWFETDDVLHIHLGLFGRIRNRKLPLKEPVGAVRVRLVGRAARGYALVCGPKISMWVRCCEAKNPWV